MKHKCHGSGFLLIISCFILCHVFLSTSCLCFPTIFPAQLYSMNHSVFKCKFFLHCRLLCVSCVCFLGLVCSLTLWIEFWLGWSFHCTISCWRLFCFFSCVTSTVECSIYPCFYISLVLYFHKVTACERDRFKMNDQNCCNSVQKHQIQNSHNEIVVSYTLLTGLF